jgi:hypothetical protein
MNSPDLKLHPACAVWPDMPAADFAELVADIKTKGLREAITIMPDGAILDGKNRFRACQKLGITPATVTYDGDDPIGFALSKNKYRRHLSSSQLAMTVARIEKLPWGRPPKKNFGEVLFKTRPELARESGASESSIGFAKRVLTKGESNIIAMVDSGAVRVMVAAEAVKNIPREEQAKMSVADVKQRGYAVLHTYPSNQPRLRLPPPPKPPQKKLGQILNERAQRAAAMPELTREEKELPPPELEGEQHPNYPQGVSYAEAWRIENGRVQLWPLAEKRKMQTARRWRETIAPLAEKLDVGELDTLNPNQQVMIELYLRKVLSPLMNWLAGRETQKAAAK